MAFQTAMLASEAFAQIRASVPQYKAQAQNANTVMATSNVNSDFVFFMLDQLRSIVSSLNSLKAVTGLDSFASGLGYSGTISTDCAAIVTAATACVGWISTNFPNSGGFLLDYSLNADGSRTPRVFTPAQTAGLQTQITSLIATIS